MIDFKADATDFDTITEIAIRAQALAISHGSNLARDRMAWIMDFTACHLNGNPLRLHALLAADDFNFAHDAFGIASHLDRSTGALTDCFSPRFSQHEAA